MIEKIISGGQTGVDRAALDVAMAYGLDAGGWCPKGRRAVDGPLDLKYPLKETDSKHYSQRTRLNIRDSDGTLVLAFGTPRGGTALTIRLAEELGKPFMVVDLRKSAGHDLAEVMEWLQKEGIRTLNVAGPREAPRPYRYDAAARFLAALLEAVRR